MKEKLQTRGKSLLVGLTVLAASAACAVAQAESFDLAPAATSSAAKVAVGATAVIPIVAACWVIWGVVKGAKTARRAA